MKLVLFASLAALTLLPSCGFRPMYGDHSMSAEKADAGNDALSSVKIGMIPDREGQFLRNELIDRINSRGEPENPRYTLNFSELKIDLRELDLTKSSEATRSQAIAATGMTLIDNETGEAVLVRSLKSISSYNILPSEFATNVTEQAARESAVRDLARQAEYQLSLYFNR